MLLPCRNAGRTLDEAMESLAGQTLEEFEIVAVDDGSTDDTLAILEEWRNKDPRVRILATEHLGIVSALNSAASMANAPLLARMDADDISLPRRLEQQLEYLDKNPELAGCGTGVEYFPRTVLRDGARRYERWINSVVSPDDVSRELFVECPIPHPSLMIRKEAFESVGKYQDRGWPEDYDLVLRLWGRESLLGKLPEILLNWRESPNRLSRTSSVYSESAFRNCKAYYLGKRIGGRSVVVCGAGPVGKAFARALLNLDHSLAAFIDLDPRKIGQDIHGAKVFHPDSIKKFRDSYVVAAVGSPKGRREIREMLAEAGFSDPEDCCAVA